MLAALSAFGLALLSQSPAEPIEARVATYRKAEGAEARSAALVAIAELANSPDGPGADAIARALAPALRDDSLAVRAKAVELLAGCDAPEVVLPELARATHDQIELEREFDRRIKELGSKAPSNPFAKRDGSGEKIKKEYLDEIERFQKELDALQEFIEGVEDHPLVREALVAAFANLGDDRSVDALGLLVESAGHGARADSAVDALLGYATGPAFQHVVDHVVRFEGARARMEKDLRDHRRERPARKPDYFQGTDEAWEQRERDRIEQRLAPHEERARTADAWIETLCARLRAFGEPRGLPAAPKEPIPARLWRDWGAKCRDLLPASLPKGAKEGAPVGDR